MLRLHNRPPPLSLLRDTAGLDSARCNRGRIVWLKLHKRNTPPRLLSRLMARVYIGFHQQSHYPTAESALADRCNECRIQPFPFPQNPLKTGVLDNVPFGGVKKNMRSEHVGVIYCPADIRDTELTPSRFYKACACVSW